jgi:hypothetical protein
MGIPDGAHTHGSGGGGFGEILAALGVLLVVAAVAGPVVAAVGELVHILLVIAAVLAGVAGAGLVAFIACRWHRYHHRGAARATALPPGVARAAQPLAGAQQRAIERPGESLWHVHIHGGDAEAIAEIVRQLNDGRHND